MVAEFGHYALILSFGLALLLSIFPLWGVKANNLAFIRLARPLSFSLFFTLTVAFLTLFYLFAVNDFSVQYVVNNSNTHLPLMYRLSAVWGSHEGSLLLWVWLLSLHQGSELFSFAH